MGQDYSLSDHFTVSPTVPYAEPYFPSNGHFNGDQLGCLYASPGKECTDDQCAYLRFRNPPVDQFGNEVYIDEPSDWASIFNRRNSIVDLPQVSFCNLHCPPSLQDRMNSLMGRLLLNHLLPR